MQFKIAYFPDGKLLNNIKIDSHFPLRDGGASELEMYMICDLEKVVALVPDRETAVLISDALNADYYAKGNK